MHSNLFIFFFFFYFCLEAQIKTQRMGRRPYGVGLLVASYDVGIFNYYNSNSFFYFK